MEHTDLLVFWPTTRCNLKCRYCYARAQEQGEDMDWEIVHDFLEQFKNRHVKVQFAGGEPLLRPDLIWKTADYLRREKPDTVIQLQTNGTRITKEIAERIRDFGIRVGVSLDGLPELNEYQRGYTREALWGIKILGDAGIPVGINAVLTNRSIQALPRLADLALMYPNIRGIALDLLRLSGRARIDKDLELPGSDEIDVNFRALYERCKKIGRIRGVPLVLREVEDAKMRLLHPSKAGLHCYASLGRSFVILPDGTCYPCGSLTGKPQYQLSEEKNFRFPALQVSEKDSCKTCTWREWCDRGCPARDISNGPNGREAECALRRAAFALAKMEIEENN